MDATPARASSGGVADVAAWLARGVPFGGRAPERRIDTHGATIFLAGDRAWKMKRPVRFGYLDFSTVDKRGAVLAEELRLNRRTAPDLYLGLHRVTAGPDGALALDGPGGAVDWLLEMRRFPDDALLAHWAAEGRLDDGVLQRLADAIFAFHGAADVDPGDDGADRLGRVVEGNGRSMAAFPDILDPARAAALTDRLRRLIDGHAELLDARARARRVRHVHGDLHLGNIAMLDGQPTPFDCLEFDRELATTDVLYDLAFLLMDLWERGLRHEANLIANRYFDRADGEEEPGFALLPMMMSVRATIRAHVMAAQVTPAGDDAVVARARHYLALADDLLEGAPPELVAIGGLSGTGKSTLARAVGGGIGRAPGARILRSDVLRKRLAGLPPEERLDPAAYTPGASERVYAELERLAAQALRGRQSVIADAVFGHAAERDGIVAAARAAGCPFRGVWLELPEAERIRRIEARPPDASDADAAVARLQSRTLGGGDGTWTTLTTTGDLPALRARFMALES